MSAPNQPQRPSNDLVMVAAVVVVVGLVAVLIAKGFLADQDRATDKAVIGNLRMIQAGADQYFMEHLGVSSVASTTIVGTNSTQYVRNWATVAQETYTPIIVQGHGISAWGVAGARTVTFGP
jgi:type II secretory pathway pseudopilin PulG